jgi:hypothetical protein
MKTYSLIIVVALLIIAGGVYFYTSRTHTSAVACTDEAMICPDGSAVGRTGPNCSFAPCPTISSGYKDSTYTIEGESVTLTNGISRVSAGLDSSAFTTTTYFGNEATGDLNGDGLPDVAFILTQNDGGSGTFYYAVVALKTKSGYQGTNGVLLGDRIAPQTTEIQNGQLVVTYADRKPGEPMSTKPSVGVSKYLKLQGGTLVEAVPVVGGGQHCGGNMTTAPVCGTGYHCAPTPGSHLPFGDVGGTCVAN